MTAKKSEVWKQELQAPLEEHIESLRNTLLHILAIIGSGFFLALFFYKQIFALLLKKQDLLILSPTEGIASVFKVCFWLSLAATSPIWLYSLASFISPGLRSHEKRLIFPFIFFSLLFFALGALFAAFITLPLSNSWLFTFNETIGRNGWSLSNYLDYSILLLLGHGIAFEAWLILGFTVYFGLVSSRFLSRKRPYVILAVLVAAAVLTPPDVATQLILAAPLLLFYELSILYAKWRERKAASLSDPSSSR